MARKVYYTRPQGTLVKIDDTAEVLYGTYKGFVGIVDFANAGWVKLYGTWPERVTPGQLRTYIWVSQPILKFVSK